MRISVRSVVGPILVVVGLVIVSAAFTLRTSPSQVSAARVTVTPSASTPAGFTTKPAPVGNAGEAGPSHASAGRTGAPSGSSAATGASGTENAGTIDGDVDTADPARRVLVVTHTVYLPVATTQVPGQDQAGRLAAGAPEPATAHGTAVADRPSPASTAAAVDGADPRPVAMAPYVVVVPMPEAQSDGATSVQLVTAISGSVVALLGAYSTLVWVRRGKPEGDTPPLAASPDASAPGGKAVTTDASMP
ncbi:MAG TPA: hypothetical protein VI248_06200 [Kineosporiaceae bacterium]